MISFLIETPKKAPCETDAEELPGLKHLNFSEILKNWGNKRWTNNFRSYNEMKNSWHILRFHG